VAEIDVRKMLEGMRGQLEKDEAEGRLAGLSVADLADAISHPLAPEVIAEGLAAESHSVQVGDPAPDWTLPWLPGPTAGPGERLTLSEHFGRRPVALIFGSYT
jgi:hypothetical protein